MTGYYGADTEQLRAQATACARGARRITDMTDATTALVDAVTWLGPDAVAFRALWHGTIKPTMLAKAEDIRAQGTELDQHAAQQDQASDVGGGGGGPLDRIIDVFEDWITSPHGPPGPFGPLTPDVVDFWQDSVMHGGQRPGQEMYGTAGYSSRDGTAGQDRPLGAYNDDFSAWDGREAEGGLGSVDGYAQGNYSLGANGTVDRYGNMTGTIGGRAGAEIGVDGQLNGFFGNGVIGSARAGAEAYAEAGGTIGPDGFSGGAEAGAGVYGQANITTTDALGGSQGITGTGYAGAYASANAYSHATRNDDGNINGWSVGFDGRAFAGAEAIASFEHTSPGGWFSGSTELKAKAGVGGGAGSGAIVSTDEIGFSVSGEIAKGLGLGGSTSLSIHPNAIVDTFTPGDYNLDDAVSDIGGAFDAAGDWWGDHSPF